MNAVTFIGFGEAAQAFSGDPAWQGESRGYDKLTDSKATRPDKERDYAAHGVVRELSIGEALDGASLILSLVTADQALAVARNARPHLRPRAIFCDMNSVAPGTKRSAEAALATTGVSYVDVAIMSPVRPAGLCVPVLVSGGAAEAAGAALSALGFSNVRVVGDRVGHASAVKMVRSVLVKGVEALTAEAMIAAERAGVTRDVLASLDDSEKQISWEARADYNLDRMLVHGLRRAEEMLEAAATLEELGVEPRMTREVARWQAEIGSLGLSPPPQGLAAKIEQVRMKIGPK